MTSASTKPIASGFKLAGGADPARSSAMLPRSGHRPEVKAEYFLPHAKEAGSGAHVRCRPPRAGRTRPASLLAHAPRSSVLGQQVEERPGRHGLRPQHPAAAPDTSGEEFEG